MRDLTHAYVLKKVQEEVKKAKAKNYTFYSIAAFGSQDLNEGVSCLYRITYKEQYFQGPNWRNAYEQFTAFIRKQS